MKSNYSQQIQANKQINNKQLKDVSKQAGDMPAFVYFSLSSLKPFKIFADDIKKSIKSQILNMSSNQQGKKWLNEILQQQFDDNFHISLSKIFRIYTKQKQLFINCIKKCITKEFKNLMVPVSFCRITILQNRFIVLQVEDGIFKQKLQKITNIVDQSIQKWKFQPYFSQPIFHVTLYRINIQILKNKLKSYQITISKTDNQNQTDKNQGQVNIEMKKTIDSIKGQLELIKLKKTCFNCKDLCIKTGVKVTKIN